MMKLLILYLLTGLSLMQNAFAAPDQAAATPHGDLKAFDATPAAAVPPTPAKERLVGVAYTTWHQSPQWKDVWGTPQGGFYASDNRAIIRQHAQWLGEAGVDFIWVDWSNNLSYSYDEAHPRPDFDMIEGATFALFDEFAKMRAEGQKTPQISIFIGNPGAPAAVKDGALTRKATQVWNQFAANPLYRPLLQDYSGKPLLVAYVNTPSPYQEGVPDWNDARFTVRWMTGFITQQHALRTPDLVSRFGYWSWEDRGPQTYPIVENHPEAMNIVACWRDDAEASGPSRWRNFSPRMATRPQNRAEIRARGLVERMDARRAAQR